jgi:hypothetical protein
MERFLPRSENQQLRRAGPAKRVFALWLVTVPLCAQDLSPRAYLITPVGSHAVIVQNSFNSGAVLIDPTIPIEDLKGRFNLPVLGYYQSFGLFGRSANVTALLPYARGNFEGKVYGVPSEAYRSGMADGRIRLSVNLNGGKAMKIGEFMKWQEKRLIGASITVTMPTGQYDPARVINIGTNRWGFKPEAGFSRRWSKVVADWYIGAWFFTPNSKFFPGKSYRTQQPVVSGEGHLGYYFKPRLWASFDVNFWQGSRSTTNGVEGKDQQRNSRIGGTVAIPITRHQSLKFSYSQGAYVTIGGDFRTVAAAWQYSWIDKPK